MPLERQPAKKVRIVDIINGKFFPGSKEEMKPSYLITSLGEKISRANIVATVTEKYESENYSNITIDDGSEVIKVKAFKEKVEILKNIEIGDLILVIGKIKKYNSETYINLEIARKIEDANYENLWKLEVLDKLIEQKKIVEDIKKIQNQLSEEELKDYVKEKYEMSEEILETILESEKIEVDYKPKILEVIEKLDEGNGVEVGKLLEFSNLDENVIESVINELLADGELFEPVPGKLRRV